jgi:hypothetical protein
MTLKTELSASQKLLLETVREQRKTNLRAAVSASGLRGKELAECRKVSDRLVADKEVRIAINANLRLRVHKDTFAEVLGIGGRLLNLFELDAALGNQDDYNMRLRFLKEFRVYGAKQKIENNLAHLPDDEHPIYGILDYIGDPFKMRGTYYGMYRFILKRDFLERATFTSGDSFGIESEDVFCWNDIMGVLASQSHELDPKRWYEYVQEKSAPNFSSSQPLYIEAQVLGPVHLIDVERLYYPCHDTVDPWFMGVLKSLADEYKFTLSHY